MSLIGKQRCFLQRTGLQDRLQELDAQFVRKWAWISNPLKYTYRLKFL